MRDSVKVVDRAAAPTGLRIDDLAKSYAGTPVLESVDLAVERGELITVLGASGSGKTTLLRLICGFERADHGRIELGHRLIADASRGLHLPPERRGVGYVAQEGALFPHLSVAENILFGLPRRERRASRAARTKRVHELLEVLGLSTHYAARKPGALSGGEQQRVALARALAPKPAVVLLDEPFSALDAGLRVSTRASVASSLKQVGATALLVTHDQDEALSMSDRVAVLQQGRLVQVATPQTLYRFPANRAVARFVGDAVVVEGALTGNAVECGFGRLEIAARSREDLRVRGSDGPVDVMIRPEQFVLGPAATSSSVGAEDLTAIVERLDFYGHDARLGLRPEGGHDFVASVPGIGLPSVGSRVAFHVVGPVVAWPRSPAPAPSAFAS